MKEMGSYCHLYKKHNKNNCSSSNKTERKENNSLGERRDGKGTVRHSFLRKYKESPW